jgi:hypothetical protein
MRDLFKYPLEYLVKIMEDTSKNCWKCGPGSLHWTEARYDPIGITKNVLCADGEVPEKVGRAVPFIYNGIQVGHLLR